MAFSPDKKRGFSTSCSTTSTSLGSNHTPLRAIISCRASSMLCSI
ncbi:Uncharacterised protein [Vibrio cholerae]|nr:Uncharacterised protein [Vibrio cholerae]